MKSKFERKINIKLISQDQTILADVIGIIQMVIKKEYNAGNNIYVNLSSGNKKLLFATQFASYLENDKVEKLSFFDETDKLFYLLVIPWKLQEKELLISS